MTRDHVIAAVHAAADRDRQADLLEGIAAKWAEAAAETVEAGRLEARADVLARGSRQATRLRRLALGCRMRATAAGRQAQAWTECLEREVQA